MAIQEQLTTKEVFNLAQMPYIIRTIPDKVYKFFETNFEFVEWKWKEREIFWQFLDEYYPQCIDYQKDIVYADELSKKEYLIGSVAWIFDILRDEQATLENQKIAFELTCCLANFWKISHEEGYLFSDSSKRLALSYLSTIDTNLPVNHNAHINEKETIETLHISLKNCQWKEIGDNHHQISNIFGQLAINHHCTYSFIVEHHIDEILNLINNEKRVWQLLYWLAPLPEQHKHNIALKTNNQLAQFLLLLNLSHLIRNELQQEQLQLSEIWYACPIEWIQIFNKYPARYSWLQLGLGKFLTFATYDQIENYIDSVELSTSAKDIKECLEYFFKYANEEKIHHFCKSAYQKWERWDFENRYSITKSSLDGAVVKYFKDVATAQERADFIHNEMNFILSFNKYWFTNIVDLHKFIYFHLSRIQPAYIADKLQQNNSLLFDDLNKDFYYPNLFQEDQRWRNWVNLDRL